MKYTLSEIAVLCGGRLTGSPQAAATELHAVTTDSRNSGAGADTLFVAIAGRNHNGHTYIGDLYARGVRSFLTEEQVAEDRFPEAGFVRTADSVAALQTLAADWRSGFVGVVVGITGSNGKTVVKEWIAELVPPGVKLFRSPKSYNSQTGVPLSVLMADGTEDVVVVEAGISERGEMERLERIVRPDIGILTTIGDAHQENFVSLAEKADEKALLFRRSRTVIYNGEWPEAGAALRRAGLAARLVDASAQSEVYAMFADRASAQNAAQAVALCDLLGYDHGQTLGRAAGLHPVAMRLELKEGINNSLIINDSYNSDINSLSIALDYMAGVGAGRRRTLILSDILQSGFAEQELYRKVAQMAAAAGVEMVIGIGPAIGRNAALFGPGARFYPTVEACIRNLRREDTAGRVILLKGNRASRFETLSHALESRTHTTTLEIDLDAMVHNLNTFRSLLGPGVKTMAMVKASGYGHGSGEVAATLQHHGTDYLAVAFADEGVALRESGITMPVVVLNADADSFPLMVGNGLEPEIYSLRSLEDFVAVVRRHGEFDYPVHIKLDTGMHRLGFAQGDLPELRERLAEYGRLIRVASVFSHLASSDCPQDDPFTHSQIALFEAMSREVCDSLPYKPLRHIANSAAIGRMPQAQFDMVRLGIGLYGMGSGTELPLKPVAALKTRIVQIKRLAPGDTVGYGRAGKIDKPMIVATVPVGYADGLDRRLGQGRWSMTVGGVQAPTVGRICMDTCMIDVTGIDASEGDAVTIIGPEAGIRMEDMARILDTIPYEIMTGISQRVKRIYLKE